MFDLPYLRKRALQLCEDYCTTGVIQDGDALECGAFVEELTDETQADAKWLVSVGARKEENPLKMTFSRDAALSIGLWACVDGWKAMLLLTGDIQACIVRGLKTRCDVRKFALGNRITLKEGNQ